MSSRRGTSANRGGAERGDRCATRCRRGALGPVRLPDRQAHPRDDECRDRDHGDPGGGDRAPAAAGSGPASPRRSGQRFLHHLVEERTAGGEAIRGPLGQPPGEHPVERGRQRRVERGCLRNWPGRVGEQQRNGVRVGVGSAPGEHLESDAGQRVEIGPVPARPARLFGRHVPGRTEVLTGQRRGGGAHFLGDTEVGEKRLAIGVNEDVGRFDVAMNHAPAVRVVEALRDRPEDRQRPRRARAIILE